MLWFAKYITYRELIKTDVTTFDEKPENQRGWYSTFKTTVNKLDITATQDLLIRWLGLQSAECIKRTKVVHLDNSVGGLNASWDRLEHCFGSPEAIENTFVQKFAKLSKDIWQRQFKVSRAQRPSFEFQFIKAKYKKQVAFG